MDGSFELHLQRRGLFSSDVVAYDTARPGYPEPVYKLLKAKPAKLAFTVGKANVPLHHPAISLALMAVGTLAAPPGQLIIGRDPSKASLVSWLRSSASSSSDGLAE